MSNDLTMSTSVQTVHPARSRPSHSQCHCQYDHDRDRDTHSVSQHSSPRSAALPSPPDSPSSDSLSSLPSLSSSFFFSSGAASPHHGSHHSHTHSGSGSEPDASAAGLIIPSLTLPAALPQPTAYGQTLGEVSLLLVGPRGAGKAALAEFLVDADDVVDAGEWEETDGGRTLHASTDWIEERDAHGLERFEGTRNVSIVEFDDFDMSDAPETVADKALQRICSVFRDVRDQLDNSPASPLLHSLLASPQSTLYTALIYVATTPLSPNDNKIITALAPHIPVIPFSSTALPFSRHPHPHSANQLSTFQPRSHAALRAGLFRSPKTLAALRGEAADRFMRWREVERAVDQRGSDTARERRHKWDKAAWETSLSEEFARRIRLSLPVKPAGEDEKGLLVHDEPCFSPTLDPLHLRSLMMLSFSLFTPAAGILTTGGGHPRPEARSAAIGTSELTTPASTAYYGWRVWRWGLALVSVFCAGVGIGLALSS